MQKYKEYKGELLQRGSTAYQLLVDLESAKTQKDADVLRKKLEAHLRSLNDTYMKLTYGTT